MGDHHGRCSLGLCVDRNLGARVVHPLWISCLCSTHAGESPSCILMPPARENLLLPFPSWGCSFTLLQFSQSLHAICPGSLLGVTKSQLSAFGNGQCFLTTSCACAENCPKPSMGTLLFCYTYMHTSMHTSTCRAYMCTRMHTCAHIHAYAYMHAHVHMRVYIYTHVCIHVYTCVHIHAHIRIHTYRHTHVPTHTHHTHIHATPWPSVSPGRMPSLDPPVKKL